MSIDDIRWVRGPAIQDIHDSLIAEHGGSYGVLDQKEPSSAYERVHTAALYKNGSMDTLIPYLAANYADAICNGHLFVDGNKRTAAVVMGAFMKINGFQLMASQMDLEMTIILLATGKLNVNQLAAWLTDNSQAVS